jgi:hypothetical protein
MMDPRMMNICGLATVPLLPVNILFRYLGLFIE